MKHAIFIILMALPANAGASELCENLSETGQAFMYAYQYNGMSLEDGERAIRENVSEDDSILADVIVTAVSSYEVYTMKESKDHAIVRVGEVLTDWCVKQEF